MWPLERSPAGPQNPPGEIVHPTSFDGSMTDIDHFWFDDIVPWISGRVWEFEMTGGFQPIIDGLKKEIERLEKIAAIFEKSNSVHLDSLLTIIDSVKQHIRTLESHHS